MSVKNSTRKELAALLDLEPKEEEIAELDKKIDKFIDWYAQNVLRGHVSPWEEKHLPLKLRDMIEKVAVWYELRYPNYDIASMLLGSLGPSASERIFTSNPYVDENLGTETLFKLIDWHAFYNFDAFLATLSKEENELLRSPSYREKIYLDRNRRWLLTVSPEGMILDTSEISLGKESLDKFFLGKHLSEVKHIADEQGISLEDDSEVDAAIEEYEKNVYFYEELLNSIMYRIIERGGTRNGAKRAFLFAKEFNRNIDIPMRYGVDIEDPLLREFINVYLLNGGSNRLICYTNYESRLTKKAQLRFGCLADILKYLPHDEEHYYTPQEEELHQSLVDYLGFMMQQTQDVDPAMTIDEVRLIRQKNTNGNE